MDDVASQFTESAETDEALVMTILTSPKILDQISEATKSLLLAHEPISCTARENRNSRPATASMVGWRPGKVVFRSVGWMHTYRIGDQEWCTAEVQWHVGGYAPIVAWPKVREAAGFAWTTSVLFTPDAAEPRLTVLRDTPPRPLSDEEFEVLAETPPRLDATEQWIRDIWDEALAQNPLQDLDLPPGVRERLLSHDDDGTRPR